MWIDLGTDPILTEGMTVDELDLLGTSTNTYCVYSDHLFDGNDYDISFSVEWYNAGEGHNGDYNPDDPNDENLLRFAVSIFNGESWEEVDDASYCTRIRANADDEQLARTLYYIFREYRNVIDEYLVEHFVKKLGESLSWISL